VGTTLVADEKGEIVCLFSEKIYTPMPLCLALLKILSKLEPCHLFGTFYITDFREYRHTDDMDNRTVPHSVINSGGNCGERSNGKDQKSIKFSKILCVALISNHPLGSQSCVF
jgi:hypothetical protein